jgi:hypothetical protein
MDLEAGSVGDTGLGWQLLWTVTQTEGVRLRLQDDIELPHIRGGVGGKGVVKAAMNRALPGLGWVFAQRQFSLKV